MASDPPTNPAESTKPWGEKRLNGWRDFIEAVEPLSRNEGATLFRGQTRDDENWSLKPSLVRAAESFGLPAADVIQVERAMLLQFQQVAHLYFPASALPLTDSATHWLMLMQHHRAPTRLLDWTESPYVAAYFACIDHWDHDGVVWWFHERFLEMRTKDRYGEGGASPKLDDPNPPPRIHALHGRASTERMLAQRGAFTICDHPLVDHADVIPGRQGDRLYNSGVCRFVIPGKHKRSILEQLRVANITAASLFPGADGLGLGLKELLTMRMAKIEELNMAFAKTAEAIKAALSMTANTALDDMRKSLERQMAPLARIMKEGLFKESLFRQRDDDDPE